MKRDDVRMGRKALQGLDFSQIVNLKAIRKFNEMEFLKCETD